ncbi:hypothetical protein [Thermoactinospora rubra]|uniref:hypothetical protein n=1 Tax=Thermoactinospora rubra TaxID=1088767 RepID=UPI000A0F771B|nr:hypothetical protein [Thermoactinospora rubra]
MSRFTKAWLIWLGVTLGGFGVIEGLALASGDMDATLSGHLRLWLGLDPGKPWGIAGGIAFLAGLVWLGWHIVFDRDR